jgi:putative ABC transport system ATP-binding protein
MLMLRSCGAKTRAVPVTPALVLSNVTKVYHRRAPVTAVRDVSLRIDPRERLAIMGPSGSGKSTLLNLMGGLDVPTSGSVMLDGVDLASLTERQRSLMRRTEVAYVFQAYHLLPTLTCEQNVAMPLHLQGRPQIEIDTRVARALTDVDLAARAGHLPDELSGGERQRVAIARAMVTEPKILLADEPTGNLDTESAAHVLTLLCTVTRARESTLVIVTHNAALAELCDRTITLRDGAIDSRPM